MEVYGDSGTLHQVVISPQYQLGVFNLLIPHQPAFEESKYLILVHFRSDGENPGMTSLRYLP